MAAIFTGRKTVVTLNDYLPSIIQAWQADLRQASEIAHSSDAELSNVVYLPRYGWRLKSYHLSPGDAAWYSAAQPGILSPGAGDANIPSGFTEIQSFSQRTLPGVIYAPDVQSSGTPMIVKRVPAGTNWNDPSMFLGSDQGSFPSPNTGEDQVSLDRVFVSQTGLVEPWDNLLFQVYAPASAILPRGFFAGFYFNGPAGSDENAQTDSTKMGTGQYALKLRGDGRAYLYEKLADTSWKGRFSFMWNTDPLPVTGMMISITVIPRVWQDNHGNYIGDSITFIQDSFGQTPNSFTLIESLIDLAQLSTRIQKGVVPMYNVPRITDQPITVCPVRVDIARDCRASFQVCRHVYESSGYILDDFISFDQPLTIDIPIYIYLNGILPTGTSWTIQCFDENGTALTALSPIATYNTANGQTSYQPFRPTAGQRYGRIKVTMNSDVSNLRSPTLISYERYRSPEYSSDNPLTLVTVPQRSGMTPAFPRTVVSHVEISPQGPDPGAENASVQIEDFTGELAFLGERHMIPILISSEVTVAGVTTSCPIFRGYVIDPQSRRHRGDGSRDYPAQEWTEWTLGCVGEWARTQEGLLPMRKQWVEQGGGPTAGQPNKITDIIYYSWATRYPADMLDVPDLPIRLFSEDPGAYVGEPLSRIADTTEEFANDYLGAYILFDEAAGDRGMLRLLQQKAPPYNNLAVFEIDHPTALAGDGVPRLPQWAASYATTTAGAQEVRHTFIKAGSYGGGLEKADGNCVVVQGAAVGDNVAALGAQDGALLTQVAYKVDSCNFFNLPNTNPNYPNGSSPEFYGRVVLIEAIDFKCQTELAIDYKTRRIFDKSCWVRFYLSFDAPMLLVTDVTDPFQNTPRRLRFYDAVQVRNLDGTLSQFLVLSCTPTISKDNFEMARYVLVTQGNINTIGAIKRRPNALSQFAKAFDKLTASGIATSRPVFAQGKQGQHLHSRAMGLPQATLAPIQDLNPSSHTFGKFYYLPDYDPLGSGVLR